MVHADVQDNIVDRLEDVGCDREPFTPDHAKCICRLTNEAAKEILRLRQALASETEECAKLRKSLAAAEERLGEIQSAHYDQSI